MSEQNLDALSDEELGKLVRETAAFRAAAACRKFAAEAEELRENDALAYERIIDETHQRQPTGVSSRNTTAEIIDEFIDTIKRHAAMDEHPPDAAEEATQEAMMGDADE